MVEIIISYLRYSLPEQALGRSERRQIDEFREWAAERGIGFDDSYRDEGMPAFRGAHRRHGDLARFLDGVRTGRLDTNRYGLGIESFDRLTREHRLDAFPLFSEIVNSGVTVIVQSLSYLELTRERVLQEPYLLDLVWAEMGRSHLESVRKSGISSDNRKAEQRAAREAKIPVTARCPPWLTLPRQEGTRAERAHQRLSRKYVVTKDRAKIVVLIFEWAAEGFSASDIANRLNEKKIGTLTGTSVWKRNQVQWLLANKAVIGAYVPGHYVDAPERRKGRRRVRDSSAQVEGYYPKIVSEDLWQRARRAIENQSAGRRTGGGRKGPDVTNLFSRLGICHVCKSPLHYTNGYLRCSLSLQRGACKNNTGFPYARLEEILMDLDSGAIADLLPAPSPDLAKQVVADLDAEIARKKSEILHMARSYAGKTGAQAEAAMIVQDELNADIERLTKHLAEAREQLSVNGPDERKGFVARLKAYKAQLGSTDARERRDARVRLSQEFHRHIERIVLAPAQYRSPQRYVGVHLSPDPNGAKYSYVISPQGLWAIHAVLPDGREVLFRQSDLDRIESQIQIPDDADDLSEAEFIRRSTGSAVIHRFLMSDS